MAEPCAFSRSGANSASIRNCPDFAENKDGKGGDRESSSCCLHPWECHCLYGSTRGRVMSPLAVSCLAEHKPLHQDSRVPWSPLSVGLSLLLLSPSAASCLWQSTTVRDLLPSLLSPWTEFCFPPPLYFSSKGYSHLIINGRKNPPFVSVTDIKEATLLKLNSIVTTQNEVIIESRRAAGYSWGYKCCSCQPWIKGIVFLEKNPFSLKNLLLDWGSFLGTTLNLYILFSMNWFWSGRFSSL